MTHRRGQREWTALGRAVALAALVVLLLLIGTPPRAFGATPVPSEPAAGDTRSSGEGAGLVGQPLVAVAIVVAVGVAAAVVTLAYVRVTASRRD